MTSKKEDLQHYFERLESLHPNRGFTVQQLPLIARDTEFKIYRSFGDIGDEWGTPAIVNELVKALSHDPEPKIRALIANSLGEIAYMIVHYQVKPISNVAQIAEQGLVSALKDESRKVQKAAAKALRKIGTVSALAAIPSKPWWKFW